MPRKNSITSEAVWGYMPQFFIGLFFLAAGFLKWWEALFGPHRVPLKDILVLWLDRNWPVEIYGDFMTASIPYADTLAWAVVLLQAVGGLLLILRWKNSFAGVLLIFVQLNVYLAIYHQLELRILNSIAIWIGIFYFARQDMREKIWTLMTYALVYLMFVDLYSRYVIGGDPFPGNFGWQYEDFTYLTMSSWPGLKAFVVRLSSGAWGPTLWAAGWWVKMMLALGMLTKYRLYFGSALLCVMLWTTMVWLNTYSCIGALWVLILFLWVTHEQLLQRASKKPVLSLLP